MHIRVDDEHLSPKSAWQSVAGSYPSTLANERARPLSEGPELHHSEDWGSGILWDVLR